MGRHPFHLFRLFAILALASLLLRWALRLQIATPHGSPCCIWPSHPQSQTLLKVPFKVHPSFDRYEAPHTGVPTWIVSTLGQQNGTGASTIHRFFDSSPFSPSGRFIAAARLPLPQTAEQLKAATAAVVVIDLAGGKERVVARTLAWGAQVGAHVQWGSSDRELFYNQAAGAGGALQGVLYDVEAQSVSKVLPCPVYHASPDGKFTAAPHLLKIRNTQFGYGVDYYYPRDESNANAPTTDGLFVNDVEAASCRLVASLRQFAVAAGLDTAHTPMYGFHTKWSHDGRRLLFVMRSLERARGLQGALLGHRVRRQHLFALNADGSNIRHLLSWSSKSFDGEGEGEGRGEGDGGEGGGGEGDALDANHPNWIPGSYNVSVNIKGKGRPGQPWTLAVLSADEASPPQEHAPLQEVYAPSSGHPNFAPEGGGRFALLDVYAKERHLFGDYLGVAARYSTPPASARHHDALLNDGGVFAPLRLVDTLLGREVWLLHAQLVPDDEHTESQSVSGPAVPNKQRRAWRCDMHPAFSRRGDWVAFNARPHGAARELLVAYLGSSLPDLFSTPRSLLD